MIRVLKTSEFQTWFKALRDPVARQRILVRIDRLALGNPGDVKPVGAGVSELRIPHGPGYRLYFVQRGNEVVVLLCGGDKSTQEADIRQAKALAQGIAEHGSGTN